MTQFGSFTGTVTNIQTTTINNHNGCSQMIEMQNNDGNMAHFILSPQTYVLNQEMLNVGDVATGYFDADAPMILIYPPQYPAIVMVKEHPGQNVKVSHFDDNLVSRDHWLSLNPTPYTPIITTNGQRFMDSPQNHNLVVVYGPSTKSIPAQTTPDQIVVLCRDV